MTIEEQLRALGDHLDEVQEPITAPEARHRAATDVSDVDAPAGRRLLLIAAAVVLVVGGVVSLVALAPNDEDPLQPVDSGVIPAPVTTAATSPTMSTNPVEVPSPTTVAAKADTGWSGGLLDDLDTDSLRPLSSYTEGDVIIPTGPSGWRVLDSTWTSPADAVGPDFLEWSVDVIEAQPDGPLGYVVYLSLSREPRCLTTLGCRPSGEMVTIDGVVWESVVVERVPDDEPEFFDQTTLRAQVGDRWISVDSGSPQSLNGRPLLDNPPIIEFLEGLRVGPPDVLRAIGEACCYWHSEGTENDPFAAVGPDNSDGQPTATPDPPDQVSDDDVVTGRSLSELVAGDVVIATYIPAGFTFDGATLREDPGGVSTFELTLTSPFATNDVRVTLSHGNGPFGTTHHPTQLNDLKHPPIEIQGLVWGWYDDAMARIAYVDSFVIDLGLIGLDRSEAERFIEGLRAVPLEEFPDPITIDG